MNKRIVVLLTFMIGVLVLGGTASAQYQHANWYFSFGNQYGVSPRLKFTNNSWVIVVDTFTYLGGLNHFAGGAGFNSQISDTAGHTLFRISHDGQGSGGGGFLIKIITIFVNYHQYHGIILL